MRLRVKFEEQKDFITRFIQTECTFHSAFKEEDESFTTRFIQTQATLQPSFGEITVINTGGGGGGSFIPGGVQGDIIIKRSSVDYDAVWVAPAQSVEEDNTRPITSAAVYTEIGNINALLATI